MEEDSIDEVVDSYHESRVDATSAGIYRLVTIEDAIILSAEHDRLAIKVEDSGETYWLRFQSKAYTCRTEMMEPFDIGTDAGLVELVGSRQELCIDRGEGVVRRKPGGFVIGEVTADEPDEEPQATIEEFDRILRAERTLKKEYPAWTKTRLSVQGGTDTLTARATIGGETFEWTYPIPSPENFDDSNLQELLEAVGAHDPEGLDGHTVAVCLEHALWQDETRFVDDSGFFSIIPRDEISKTPDYVSETPSEPEGSLLDLVPFVGN